MVSFTALLVTLLASSTLARPDGYSKKPQCLSDHEALSIATRWLDIWGTGYITKKSQLKSLVTKDIQNYDATYGPPINGIDALFASATFVDPLVDKVAQVPQWVFHDCDQIAARWTYTAVATGTGNGS
jgi:hypothetical protein